MIAIARAGRVTVSCFDREFPCDCVFVTRARNFGLGTTLSVACQLESIVCCRSSFPLVHAVRGASLTTGMTLSRGPFSNAVLNSRITQASCGLKIDASADSVDIADANYASSIDFSWLNKWCYQLSHIKKEFH